MILVGTVTINMYNYLPKCRILHIVFFFQGFLQGISPMSPCVAAVWKGSNLSLRLLQVGYAGLLYHTANAVGRVLC